MFSSIQLSNELKKKMVEKGIDVELTLELLNNYNRGKYDHIKPVKASDLPDIDGETILDMVEEGFAYRVPGEAARESLHELGLEESLLEEGERENDSVVFTRGELEKIGVRCYPLLAYGILNGGSATSYVDVKKNSSFNETIFRICRKPFDRLAEEITGLPKGVTPAFINPDGSPGPSYMELKLRSLLLEALRYQTRYPQTSGPAPLHPFFQMTSVYTHNKLEEALQEYRESPLLKNLIAETGLDITRPLSAQQPLIAAYTHSDEGEVKFVSSKALPLPGGHGQNFQVLKEVYQQLHAEGKRFVYLGNVDNLGNTVDPVSLALMALSGKQAGFEFSFKTPVDVKGGILLRDQEGRLQCADIGSAISREDVARAEQQGKPILFNCATGLFNLDFLVGHLDYIIENLPVRFHDQEKDIGKYSQAEQVTWEVIGLLDNFFVFAVDKYERFLAAKTLLENLMTSGIGLDHPDYPTSDDPGKDLKSLAANLHAGLTKKLETTYGMQLSGNKWVPVAP
jgi:hypothetical protein